jgi:biotin operon repressor
LLGEAERVIAVHVKYGEIEQTFTGNVNDVWVSVNKFFSEMIPAFDIARKVTLTVDLAELIEEAKGVIAIAPEGPEVLVPKEKLTDSEALQFYLLGAFIAFRLGKRASDAMSKEELQAKLGKSPKITSTRLSELVKEGSVVKTDEGGYRLATVAVKRLQGELKAIQKEIW